MVDIAYLDSATFQVKSDVSILLSMCCGDLLIEGNGRLRKAAQKRGGNRQRIPLADDLALSPERDEDVLALDDALNALAEIDERRATIVELRFFSGMTVQEVALVLSISETTVGREWAATRLWLRKYLAENPPQ